MSTYETVPVGASSADSDIPLPRAPLCAPLERLQVLLHQRFEARYEVRPSSKLLFSENQFSGAIESLLIEAKKGELRRDELFKAVSEWLIREGIEVFYDPRHSRTIVRTKDHNFFSLISTSGMSEPGRESSLLSVNTLLGGSVIEEDAQVKAQGVLRFNVRKERSKLGAAIGTQEKQHLVALELPATTEWREPTLTLPRMQIET